MKSFSFHTWSALLVSLCALPFVKVAVSRAECRLGSPSPRYWTRPGNAAWYTYGTLIGESITRIVGSDKAWSTRCVRNEVPLYSQVFVLRVLDKISLVVRCVIGGWILSALITAAAYGGTLRAFLLKPEFSSPINTLQEVVESGLPWNFVLYGDEFETLLAKQEDEVTRQFWDEKEVVEYNDYPVDRVTKRKKFSRSREFYFTGVNQFFFGGGSGLQPLYFWL